MSSDELVRIGRIAAAHGIRGEVKIRCFTEVPEDVSTYGALRDGEGRAFTLFDIRPAKGPFVIARVKNVADRNAAESLVGRDLYVLQDALPPPQDEEWYYSDLVGLSAFDPEGRSLGTVVAVYDFGAGDLIEIAPPAGKPFMVPFTAACAPDINVSDGTITIIPLRDADED